MDNTFYGKGIYLRGQVFVVWVLALIMVLCVGSHTNAASIQNDSDSEIEINKPKLVSDDDGQEYMCYDIVEFGSYPQSDPSGSSKDPIKWRVIDIDDEKVLLWADSILDYRVFDPVDNGGKYWDICELRNWLMGEFADAAFSIDEKKAISYIDHWVNYPESDKFEMVRDSVFLPDMDELYSYNYKDVQSRYINNNRQILYWRYSTAYAHLIQVRAGGSPDNLDGYWLRTSGNQNGIYQYVKQDKYDSFNNESVWYNSAIDTPRILLGVCPMVYVSKAYLEQTLKDKENRVIRPYTEYAPPYADTVWVDDEVKDPRYKMQDGNENSVVYDIVEMGSYPQSDKNGVEKEPIKWRVMNATETKLVLMADSILDYSKYNESSDRNGIYWGSSDVRKWLNDYFYNNAFNEAEKKEILLTTHENGSKLMDSVYKGKTDDCLMLPAYDDICEWMQEGKDTLSQQEQTAVIWRYPTAYSYEQYKKTTGAEDDGLSYWLGTSSSQDGYYMNVIEEETEGNIRAVYSQINSSAEYLGICPVMVVNRSDAGIYHKTGEKKVTVIEEIKLPFSDEITELGEGKDPAGGDEGNKDQAGNEEEGEGNTGSDTEAVGGDDGKNQEGGKEEGNTGSDTEVVSGDDGKDVEGGKEEGNTGSDTEAVGGDDGKDVEGGKEEGNTRSDTEVVSGDDNKDPVGNGEEGKTGNNTNSGKAEKGSEKNDGSLQNTGSIVKEIKNAILGELEEQVYTGDSLTPELLISYGGRQLIKDVDYTVTYSNNVNSGIAYANVTGKGEYRGSVGYAFAIQPRVIDGLNTILKGKDGNIYKAVYTGSDIRPKTSFRLPVKEGDAQKRLSPQEGKDYTVSYANNRKIGVATITYRFYGNYTGIVTKDFQIVPDKVTKLSAKRKGQKTILTWKKVKGAAGYDILRASKKNGKYKRIARLGNKGKYTDKKAKKKYYYKVRAFGKNSGVRYYGSYTIVKAM